MGNISFYHRNGKGYWRTKPTTSYPGTPTQMIHAAIHSRALKTLLIPDHKKTWHLDLPEYQTHIRYFLIDTQTGYRSREIQISVRFKV